jgi:tetratricopeptide (TPR) repeat protein
MNEPQTSIGTALFAVTLLLFLSACSSLPERARDVIRLNIDAEVAYEEGRCEEAVKLYREIADHLPKDTQSLLRIGNCHARGKNTPRAIDAYREAIQRDPYFVKAWYNLSYLQAQDLGKTVAEMSMNTDPSDPSLAYARRLSRAILAAFEAESANKKNKNPAQSEPVTQ